MKINSVLVCLFFQFLLLNVASAEISDVTDVSLKRSVKILINADDAINVEVAGCLKSALKNSSSLLMKEYQPDLIVRVIARQIQSDLKDPVIMLSMVVDEPFDNVAVIKHWASGFRQAFPYGATVALKNSTRGLVRNKNHRADSAPRSSLNLLCEKLINDI